MVDGVSLPLAFEDAVPVVLSTAGLVLLAKGIGTRAGRRHGEVALVAALCVGLGGVAKVSWKLIAAGAGHDVTWLDEFLFPLLAVGFVGMVLSLRAARVATAPGVTPAPRVLTAMGTLAVGLTLVAAVDAPIAVRLAMVVAIVASITTSVLLVRIALGAGDRRSAALLGVNLAATLGLGRLAAVESQTLGLQWLEQGINTVSQGLFLLAAARIARDVTPWAAGAGEAAEPEAREAIVNGTLFR